MRSRSRRLALDLALRLPDTDDHNVTGVMYYDVFAKLQLYNLGTAWGQYRFWVVLVVSVLAILFRKQVMSASIAACARATPMFPLGNQVSSGDSRTGSCDGSATLACAEAAESVAHIPETARNDDA